MPDVSRLHLPQARNSHGSARLAERDSADFANAQRRRCCGTSHQQDAVEAATALGRPRPATRRHRPQPRAHGERQRTERALALPHPTSRASADQQSTRSTIARHRSRPKPDDVLPCSTSARRCPRGAATVARHVTWRQSGGRPALSEPPTQPRWPADHDPFHTPSGPAPTPFVVGC
jgi:hypothetical protein